MVQCGQIGQFPLPHSQRLSRSSSSILLRQCIGIICPQIPIKVGEGRTSREKSKPIFEFANLYLQIGENFDEFECSNTRLGNISAIYAVEAVYSHQPTLIIQHLQFFLQSINPESSKITVIDGILHEILEKGVELRVIIAITGGMQIEVGVPNLTPHLLLTFLLTQLPNKILIVFYQLSLFLRRRQQIQQKQILKLSSGLHESKMRFEA